MSDQPETETRQLRCICGALLPSSYLQTIKAHNHYATMKLRDQTQGGMCDKCIKKRNKVLDEMRKKKGRYLW